MVITKKLDNRETISDIAIDLKRAATASGKVSDIFLTEALEKRNKIKEALPEYIKKILTGLNRNSDKEDLLMYSTLLQNYSLNYGK